MVAIASATMGEGSEELGKTLLKAFVFALTQQDKLPKTILFYNGGAALTCEALPCWRISRNWRHRAWKS